MTADYKPGTVAKATVRGVPDVTVMAGYGTSEPRLRWLTTDERLVDELNDGWYFAFDVTDVRPLVVLDLGDLAVLKRAWENTEVAMKEGHTLPFILQGLRDEILRQTKPPRIPEPGLWGVVEAAVPESGGSRWPFVHDTDQGSSEWTCVNDGDHYDWDALVDPVLIREGVES